MAIEFLIVSNVLLWCALVAGAVLLLGIARQVGLLHERSAPLGAMITDHGPDVGEAAPHFHVTDFRDGRPVHIGGTDAAGRETLLMFTSPTCPVCDKLLPIVKSVAGNESIQVVLVSDGDRQDHERFLKAHPLGDIPYVVSAEIGMRFQVGKIPYAVLLDEQGGIRAKGLVNTREHLESLLEASRTGYRSLQDYVARNGLRPNGAGTASAATH
jgi:methylamine dehydrogenase accessory protein MauD